uniref:CC domain-containing protein n=1 Tax=Meloidogyne javanica TaxID=6303 RepID=A0A915LLD4_MELJA
MPVIGGLCHLDSQDVHIGGKQTQFFLRCEPISESLPGEGVWVVKSKNVGSNAPRISAAALIKSEQQQIRKTSPKMSSYICDLVSDAHEHGFCSVSENCLQPVYTDRNAFLQCDSTTRRWHKKHCQPSFNFDFERQACIAHTVVKQGHHHFRQFPVCPGGGPPIASCSTTVCSTPANVCCAQATAIPATGFTCNQGLCCSNSSQTPRCLDGSQSIGACIQGRCGTGYTSCPPGQVSIGLAVNGRCPTGYTLVNGQCCGTQSSQAQISCPQIDSSGPCDRNQQCSEPGYACDISNNWCCPQVFENEDPIGPCIEGEGGTRLCPEGYACVGDGEGECRRLDTGTCAPEEQLGPCGPNNECPAGYECIEGFCCRIDNGGRSGSTRRYRRGITELMYM